MNENRFFLWKRIIIKIKTRDKKKFSKKFHGSNFPWGQFSRGIFPRTDFAKGYACIVKSELKLIANREILYIQSTANLGKPLVFFLGNF